MVFTIFLLFPPFWVWPLRLNTLAYIGSCFPATTVMLTIRVGRPFLIFASDPSAVFVRRFSVNPRAGPRSTVSDWGSV